MNKKRRVTIVKLLFLIFIVGGLGISESKTANQNVRIIEERGPFVISAIYEFTHMHYILTVLNKKGEEIKRLSTERQIKQINSNGVVENVIEFYEFCIADNKNEVALIKCSGKFFDDEKIPQCGGNGVCDLELILLDSLGEEVWKKQIGTGTFYGVIDSIKFVNDFIVVSYNLRTGNEFSPKKQVFNLKGERIYTYDLNEIAFFDEKDNIIKLVDLRMVSLKRKIKDSDGKLLPGTIQESSSINISDDGSKIAKLTYRLETIDGKYYYTDDEDYPSTLELEIENEKGEKLWKTKIGKRQDANASDIKILQNGNVVLNTYGDWEVSNYCNLYVFNAEGTKLFEFPDSGYSFHEFEISSNGKYLGIPCRSYGPGRETMMFFNISNGKNWNLNEDWAIHKIENDGKTHLFSGQKKMEINLKDKIGD